MTERIRVEQILQESEEKYRTLFERMAQGAVYLDGEGEVFSANPAAVMILGQSLYQLMGRAPRDPR
jgi:PAS domain S-box-containing protein